MCRNKRREPEYTAPPEEPEVAEEAEPEKANTYEAARRRANLRTGGNRRSTVLTGLRGTLDAPVLGRATQRQPVTVLG